MNRRQRQQVAADTVAIMKRGHYDGPAGRVDIRASLQRAVDGTILYRPDDVPTQPPANTGGADTRTTVANETTFEGALRLLDEGADRVVALNFASARNPGGGFLSGAQAQEECLTRASGLFACIDGSDYYAYHRSQPGGLYSHHMIYSPDVPVFRNDAGELLDAPWPCSMITSPAPNRGAIASSRYPQELGLVSVVMRERITRILAVAAHHGHGAIVLGAFGCGVFRNDPHEVAALFAEAVDGPFRGVFDRVHYAVLDKENGPNITAFAAMA